MSTGYEEGRFQDADGLELFYRLWQPQLPPRGLLLVAHGLAEHSGRYDALARHFNELGCVVAALDHVGHGQSPGRRVYVPRFDIFVAHLEHFRQHLQARFSDLPQYLLGHSMGGLISVNYLLAHQQHLQGCILSGPALKLTQQPGRLQEVVVRLLSTCWPRLGVLSLEAEAVSRDPEALRAYLADPLVHRGRLSARLTVELVDCMTQIWPRVGAIELPLLILHGSDDRLTHPQGSRDLFEAVSSQDKTLRLYPRLYHEVFNEPERQWVLADASRWLQRRLN